eukprot:m.222322 g.222322  ORF g.222322 m.222322 type:complete len:229 (+) comp10740_c0_seq1:930-1616(+)
MRIAFCLQKSRVLAFAGVATSINEIQYSDLMLCKIAHGVASALSQIHEAGLVHHDLSFGNILVLHDEVHLNDFGEMGTPGLISALVGTPRFYSIRMAAYFKETSSEAPPFHYCAFDDWLALLLVLVAFSCKRDTVVNATHLLPWPSDEPNNAYLFLEAFGASSRTHGSSLESRLQPGSAVRLRPLVAWLMEKHPEREGNAPSSAEVELTPNMLAELKQLFMRSFSYGP